MTLWEALCGAPPFVGATKELVARKLSPPPAWPKAGVPRPIVDAIVRGLAPEPEGRWPSMEALLEALSWAPTRGRNRWLFAAASLCVLGAAGMALATWAQARANRCSGGRQQLHGIWDDTRSAEVRAAIVGIGRPYATGVWERTEQELDAYASDWAAMHTEACEATTVRGEQSTQAMDLRMGCLRRTAQELRATVDTLADADEEVVQNAQELTSDLRPLSRCADVEALSAEVEPPLPAEAEAVERIRSLLAGAKARVGAGRYGQAQEAVEAAKQALAGVQYGPVHTEAALHEGLVLDVLGRYEEAGVVLTEALTLAAQWRQWEEVLSAANQLMRVVGDHQRRMDEALRYWPLAEGLSRGRPQAEASARNNLAVILGAQGKHAEAEAELRAALALREQALGPDHPDVAGSRDDLAGILVAQGKHAEAEAELRAALSVWERVLGPDHPEVALSRGHLAIVLASQGKHEEAEAELRATLVRLEEAMGPDHPHVALSRSNLAKLLHERGKDDEAEVEHRVALELLRNALGPDHLEVARSRYGLAGALFERGKYEEAEPELRAVLTTYEEALGPDHPEVATARRRLANVLLELEKAAEAFPLAEQAWERWQQGDASDGERAATAFVLARASWIVHPAEPERTRARALAEDALRSYRESEDGHASGCASAACREEADAVRRWLDEHPLL